MKNLLLLLFTSFLLTSCVSYNRIGGERVTHVLAITQSGDTVRVSTQDLRREVHPDYYSNWQFYWGNNWYWGNVWYPQYFLPYRYGYWDDWYWRRRHVIVNPTPRVQPRREVIPPRNTPRRVTPSEPRRYYEPTPRREITPQQPRTNPTQPRTPIREFNPSRGNSNGSPVIRQQPIQGSRPTRGGVNREY